MATLFEQLTQRLADAPQYAPQSKQQEIQRQLQAKTGKAGPEGRGTVASGIAEQAAIERGKGAVQLQQLQNRMAGIQLQQAAQDQATQRQQAVKQIRQGEDIAQRRIVAQETAAQRQIAHQEQDAMIKLNANESMQVRQINHQARQQLAQLATERDLVVDQIFFDFDRSEKELELRRDAAALEQRAFLLALQDEEYMTSLERIGKRRLLHNDLEYQRESLEVRLGGDFSRFLDEMNFKRAFNADAREFEKILMQLDIERVRKMFEANAKAESKRRMMTGIASMFSAGAQTAGMYKGGKKEGPDVQATEVERAEYQPQSERTYGGKQGTTGEEGPVY